MNTDAGNATLDTFLGKIQTEILNPLITLMALAAFAIFVWGVVEYIRNAANEEKRAQGTQHIVWGIIGLVIMFGAFAIVAVMNNIIGVFK